MQIKSLPFYYKSHLTNDNGGLPHAMPFDLFFDEELELLKQQGSKSLSLLLEQVYLEGSLVDGSVSSESGLHYITPIMKYIFSQVNLSKDSKILEIGFGEGVFLGEFKKLGFSNLTGIEPGNHRIGTGLEGVRLISDFYPSEKYLEKVDLIFHCLVLEHIEDPYSFLESQKMQLSSNGKIIFFVPNEEPFLKAGDCSSFIHEHFNFFTEQSVIALTKKTGLNIQDISIIEGLLAVTVGAQLPKKFKSSQLERFNYQTYLERVDFNLKAIRNFIDEFPQAADVALYVPGRALNFMYLLDCSSCRLVDDSTEIHGKFLPFFKNPIESFKSLLLNPPKAILIFSRTFGDKIKQKCLASPELRDCKVYRLDEILNE